MPSRLSAYVTSRHFLLGLATKPGHANGLFSLMMRWWLYILRAYASLADYFDIGFLMLALLSAGRHCFRRVGLGWYWARMPLLLFRRCYPASPQLYWDFTMAVDILFSNIHHSAISRAVGYKYRQWWIIGLVNIYYHNIINRSKADKSYYLPSRYDYINTLNRLHFAKQSFSHDTTGHVSIRSIGFTRRWC